MKKFLMNISLGVLLVSMPSLTWAEERRDEKDSSAARSSAASSSAAGSSSVPALHRFDAISALLADDAVQFEARAQEDRSNLSNKNLRLALGMGYAEVAKCLLRLEPRLVPTLTRPSRNFDGYPLPYALRQGQLKVADLIIQHAPESKNFLTQRPSFGDSLLEYALRHRKFHVADYIVRQAPAESAKLLTTKPAIGDPLLKAVLRSQKFDIADWILEKCPPSRILLLERLCSGGSLLGEALKKGNLVLAEYMLRKVPESADILGERDSHSKYTLLEEVLRANNLEVADFILFYARDRAKLLEERSPTTNCTPLEEALKRGALDVADFILQRARDRAKLLEERSPTTNCTPLEEALKRGALDVADFILYHAPASAKILEERSPTTNCTPLEEALRHGHVEHWDYIIAHAPRGNALLTDRYSAGVEGNTILDWVLGSTNWEMNSWLFPTFCTSDANVALLAAKMDTLTVEGGLYGNPEDRDRLQTMLKGEELQLEVIALEGAWNIVESLWPEENGAGPSALSLEQRTIKVILLSMLLVSKEYTTLLKTRAFRELAQRLQENALGQARVEEVSAE